MGFGVWGFGFRVWGLGLTIFETNKDRLSTSRALFLNIDEVLELRVFGVWDSQVAQMLQYSLGKAMLGGSWVVISGGYKSPNIGNNYSYPTYDPTYN